MTPDAQTAPCLDELAAEILTRCEILGLESERPGALTRTFLSAPMHRVHEHLSGWMRGAGMEVRLDPAANLIGRLAASGGGAEAPILVIGSHLDTVPEAGKYDGALGVLLGVAAIEALGGRRLPFAVEVVGFSEEEGVRYQTPYLGSLALSGRFDPALLGHVDPDGVSMADAFRAFGLDPRQIAKAAYPPGRVLAYLEAHIEQGPVLESWDLPVGVVTAIAGQSRLRVGFEGRAAHAGTTPMDLRRDPLPAAAELVLEVERLARSVPGLRGTVGMIASSPGVLNVVPGLATLSLDVRHAEDEVRERAVAGLLARGSEIARCRGLVFRVDQEQQNRTVPADSRLAGLLASAVEGAGLTSRRLVSGAGHDAAVMAALAPMAMLFLRSPGGISHHPDESVLPDDVRIALDVMLRFLDAFAADVGCGVREDRDGPLRHDA
jgi:allantoate deiminase